MIYYTCELESYDTNEGIIISVWKVYFFVINKINSETNKDYNSDMDGIKNCNYTKIL